MEEKVGQLLNSIQDYIKSYLYSDNTLRLDVEDLSQTQLQDLLKCMVLFNDESSNGNDNEEIFSDQYHDDSIRNYFNRRQTHTSTSRYIDISSTIKKFVGQGRYYTRDGTIKLFIRIKSFDFSLLGGMRSLHSQDPGQER